MIEIILVLLILSVLFFALRNVFQMKDKDVAYGQTCVENIFGEVSAFADAAIRSKGISSGTNVRYPEQYEIYFTPTTNTISLAYISGGTSYPYQDLGLTGTIPTQRYCKTSTFTMLLSGADLHVTINKGLAQDAHLQSFILQGIAGFTGHVDIMQCPTNSTICKQLGQFIIDTRIQTISKRLCLTFGTGGDCLEWDK